MIVMTWLPEASPQPPDKAGTGPAHPAIAGMAVRRGITSMVHFTRMRGLVGILGSGAVKARAYLPQDDQVKYVYAANAENRSRDTPWHGYINLSVSNINAEMFRYSKNWHPGEEWVILEFAPDILGHPGVVFCATNNAYPVVHRATGPAGFKQMFAERVPWGIYGSVADRIRRKPNETTCPQAEVLYPFELYLDYLHTITVGDDDTLDSVTAALTHFPYDLRLRVDPKAFAR